jgi:ABC-type multidrug transport system fused ATPase/permease subunit
MFNLIKKTLSLLARRERRAGFLLMLAILFLGIAEMIGVVSVAPFLAVAGNQELLQTNVHVAWLYRFSGLQTPRAFLVLLGCLSIATLLVTSLYRALTRYAMNRFSGSCLHSLSLRLFRNYLRQPYSYFLQNNSSEMTKNMFLEVEIAVHQVLMQLMILMSSASVAAAIVIMLVWVDPLLALAMIVFLGFCYWLIFAVTRKYILKIGEIRHASYGQSFKTASETFGGIKELKVLGREKVYIDSFSRPFLETSYCQAVSDTLALAPRYLIEALGFSAILLIAMYEMWRADGNSGNALPMLGLYAFGAQRLLPALQMIYNSLAKMRFGETTINRLLQDLQLQGGEENADCDTAFEPLALKNKIEMKNVCFAYPNADRRVISDLSLAIPVGKSVGITGATGSGKTTLVDLLLGLLLPDSGQIIIDETVLSSANVRAWQKNIGYVPQHIFLADDSVAANIAFGVSANNIDRNAVERAAKMAQIHEFIINLPEKYDTRTGERGVRLSGWQRQRIGIARALYHNPEVLVLDEATSALDNETEAEVMQAIDALSGRKTILMIAHRLTTVKKCDMIVELDKSRSGIVVRRREEICS